LNQAFERLNGGVERFRSCSCDEKWRTRWRETGARGRGGESRVKKLILSSRKWYTLNDPKLGRVKSGAGVLGQG